MLAVCKHKVYQLAGLHVTGINSTTLCVSPLLPD